MVERPTAGNVALASRLVVADRVLYAPARPSGILRGKGTVSFQNRYSTYGERSMSTGFSDRKMPQLRNSCSVGQKLTRRARMKLVGEMSDRTYVSGLIAVQYEYTYTPPRKILGNLALSSFLSCLAFRTT